MAKQDALSPHSKNSAVATFAELREQVQWDASAGEKGRQGKESISGMNALQVSPSGLICVEYGEGWKNITNQPPLTDAILEKAKAKSLELFFSQDWDPESTEKKCIAFGFNPQEGVQFYNSDAWGKDSTTDKGLTLEKDASWTTYSMDLDTINGRKQRYRGVMESLTRMGTFKPHYAKCMPRHIDTLYTYPSASGLILFQGFFQRDGESVNEMIPLRPGKKVWARVDVSRTGNIPWSTDARKPHKRLAGLQPKCNLMAVELLHSGTQITWDCYHVADFCTENEFGEGSSIANPGAWVQHEGFKCAVGSDLPDFLGIQDELGVLHESTGNEYKAPTTIDEIFVHAKAKAKTLHGCVAFAINLTAGVQWYSPEAFGSDGKLRSGQEGWTTWVCGPISQYM